MVGHGSVERFNGGLIKETGDFPLLAQWAENFESKINDLFSSKEQLLKWFFPATSTKGRERGKPPSEAEIVETILELDALLREYHVSLGKYKEEKSLKASDVETVVENLYPALVHVFETRNNVALRSKTDLRVADLPEFQEMKADLLKERSKRELAIIEPGLKDLSRRICSEKPDFVVFLDKGARLFAVPLRRFLGASGMTPLPEFRYFNDTRLKEAYLYKKHSFNTVAEDELGPLKGKKSFFVDETYSLGQGAAALEKAFSFLNLDTNYTALSKNPEHTEPEQAFRSIGYEVTAKEHLQNIERIKNDSRFVIYPAFIPELFSRVAARWYVEEDDSDPEIFGKTRFRDEKAEYPFYEDLPKTIEDITLNSQQFLYVKRNPFYGYKPPYGMSWKEYTEAKQKINLQTIRDIQNLIFDTLNT